VLSSVPTLVHQRGDAAPATLAIRMEQPPAAPVAEVVSPQGEAVRRVWGGGLESRVSVQAFSLSLSLY
jgi:hypothetical protein